MAHSRHTIMQQLIYGIPITIYNIAECVGPAYLKAINPIDIVNTFKKCGIFPFDDSIFTEEDFLPSTVTNFHFMPPLKSTARNTKRRRTLGKSMIVTDTPEKNAIAEKKKKEKSVDLQ